MANSSKSWFNMLIQANFRFPAELLTAPKAFNVAADASEGRSHQTSQTPLTPVIFLPTTFRFLCSFGSFLASRVWRPAAPCWPGPTLHLCSLTAPRVLLYGAWLLLPRPAVISHVLLLPPTSCCYFPRPTVISHVLLFSHVLLVSPSTING